MGSKSDSPGEVAVTDTKAEHEEHNQEEENPPTCGICTEETASVDEGKALNKSHPPNRPPPVMSEQDSADTTHKDASAEQETENAVNSELVDDSVVQEQGAGEEKEVAEEEHKEMGEDEDKEVGKEEDKELGRKEDNEAGKEEDNAVDNGEDKTVDIREDKTVAKEKEKEKDKKARKRWNIAVDKVRENSRRKLEASDEKAEEKKGKRDVEKKKSEKEKAKENEKTEADREQDEVEGDKDTQKEEKKRKRTKRKQKEKDTKDAASEGSKGEKKEEDQRCTAIEADPVTAQEEEIVEFNSIEANESYHGGEEEPDAKEAGLTKEAAVDDAMEDKREPQENSQVPEEQGEKISAENATNFEKNSHEEEGESAPQKEIAFDVEAMDETAKTTEVDRPETEATTSVCATEAMESEEKALEEEPVEAEKTGSIAETPTEGGHIVTKNDDDDDNELLRSQIWELKEKIRVREASVAAIDEDVPENETQVQHKTQVDLGENVIVEQQQHIGANEPEQETKMLAETDEHDCLQPEHPELEEETTQTAIHVADTNENETERNSTDADKQEAEKESSALEAVSKEKEPKEKPKRKKTAKKKTVTGEEKPVMKKSISSDRLQVLAVSAAIEKAKTNTAEKPPVPYFCDNAQEKKEKRVKRRTIELSQLNKERLQANIEDKEKEKEKTPEKENFNKEVAKDSANKDKEREKEERKKKRRTIEMSSLKKEREKEKKKDSSEKEKEKKPEGEKKLRDSKTKKDSSGAVKRKRKSEIPG